MRIAPPEAPVSGYNFGKGVYLADMAAKSLNYCRCSGGVGLILLCEASIGKTKDYFTTCYDAGNLLGGANTTKGCGLTAPPESSHIDFNGVCVPNGKGQKTNVKVIYII